MSEKKKESPAPVLLPAMVQVIPVQKQVIKKDWWKKTKELYNSTLEFMKIKE